MKKDSLTSKQYCMVDYVSGPLLFVETVGAVAYGELVEVTLFNGKKRTGQVLDVSDDVTVIQVFEGTAGVDVKETIVRYTGEVIKLGVSIDMLGRVFDGAGKPRDGAGPVVAEEKREIIGTAINPFARDRPTDFIETGVSAIDCLNTLVRGQKLPIFSCSGLPANELAAQIALQAGVKGEGERFAVVFAAIGTTHREASFFIEQFEKAGVLERTVLFLNLADDPAVERLLTPRCALTAAEYLAFNCDMHVLVLLSDMTNYCEALRQIAAAREEVPGRRGYPGYMYTDLATIYERAGRIKGKKGSITQIPILTMPDDDITHPIPDLTGYITEGQIVLTRAMHRRKAYPPIDVLPCLSRLMNLGIGKEKTREDHRGVADQLYACYAEGRKARQLVAIIGEDALSEADKKYLRFADDFEKKFVSQGQAERRSIEQTFDIAWQLLSGLPAESLKKIRKEHVEKYYSAAGEKLEEKERDVVEMFLAKWDEDKKRAEKEHEKSEARELVDEIAAKERQRMKTAET